MQENKGFLKCNPARLDNDQFVKFPYGQQDPHARVELVASTSVHSNKFSTDQMPALSARVSFASSGKTGDNPETDEKLTKYLADNLHLSPFEHQSATFKIITPLFVAREWMRHRTQSYNEVSMRYSSDPVGKTYYPQFWRQQAATNKQSSFGIVQDQDACTKILRKSYEQSIEAYKNLLEIGVCREQARLVIPVGNYTEFYATANLRNWAAFYKLRIAQDAQWEIRQYAKSIGEIFTQLWKNSWSVLAKKSSPY
jgi:thymidylate synthase (FAD)